MTTKKQQSQQGDHAIHRHVFVHFTSLLSITAWLQRHQAQCLEETSSGHVNVQEQSGF